MISLANRLRHTKPFSKIFSSIITRSYQYQTAKKRYARNNEFFTNLEQDIKIDWSKFPEIKRNIYEEDSECAKQSQEDVEKFMANNEIKASEMFRPVHTFDQMKIFPGIVKALKAQFDSPTSIQKFGIPATLSGRNLIGVSITGSGKTLSFGIPMIEHIIQNRNPQNQNKPLALVMIPTWELGSQVCSALNKLSTHANISGTLLVGGESLHTQLTQLRKHSDFVVGTPGRLNDMIIRKILDLQHVSYLVIDEADVMIDMGFEHQLRAIIDRNVRPDRQCTMWSATWNPEVSDIAARYISEPLTVKVGTGKLAANKNIEQRVECLTPNSKPMRAIEVIGSEEFKNQPIIVFCNAKDTCDILRDTLYRNNIEAVVLHGGKERNLRKQIYAELKEGKHNILIATDIASRGLDLKGVKMVLNYDFPRDIETYVHRIGRTGRVEKKGISLTFFEPSNRQFSQKLVEILQRSGNKVPESLAMIAKS